MVRLWIDHIISRSGNNDGPRFQIDTYLHPTWCGSENRANLMAQFAEYMPELRHHLLTNRGA